MRGEIEREKYRGDLTKSNDKQYVAEASFIY